MRTHFARLTGRGYSLPVLLVVLAMALLPTFAQAQPAANKKVPSAISEGYLKIKDGLQLAYRYYPGPAESTTVPVILLHGFEGQGGDFDRLARYLRSKEGGSHSVLVPDLRGHGKSTSIEPPNGDKSIKVQANRLRKDDFGKMLRLDMEAMKRFLLKEHAEESLNIEGLTLVGADLGGLLAIHFAAQDWSWPSLAGVKQGQDVRAVVLLSPLQTFKGINTKEPLMQDDVRSTVSFLMMYGRDSSKQAGTIRRINASLKRYRKTKFDSPEERRAEQDLFIFDLPTSLQSTKLLTDRQLPTANRIREFIGARVVDKMKEEFPWKSRTNPLE
ncbi:MAG: alpha/beta hydrolase [Planctomycetota bacterium]